MCYLWFVIAKFTLYSTQAKNGKAGLINSNGKLVVEYKYEYIEYYNDKIALVGIDNAFNLVHFDQKILFDKNFYDVGDFSEGFAPVKFSHL